MNNDEGLNIGHNAPYECIVCGGPEWSPTSNRGCGSCGAQDEIVPRGTVARRRKQMYERDMSARARAKERSQALRQAIATASDQEPFTVSYYDVYDDSIVTATFKSSKVELKRANGRPMWADGQNEVTKEQWDFLVRSGYFVLIDPQDSPEVAVRKLMNRFG